MNHDEVNEDLARRLLEERERRAAIEATKIAAYTGETVGFRKAALPVETLPTLRRTDMPFRLHSLYPLVALAAAISVASCATNEPAPLPQGMTFTDVLVKNSCWQGTWSGGAQGGGNVTLCFARNAGAIAGEIRDMGGASIPVNGPIGNIRVSEAKRSVAFTNVSGREHDLVLTAKGGLEGFIHGSVITVRMDLKPAAR